MRDWVVGWMHGSAVSRHWLGGSADLGWATSDAGDSWSRVVSALLHMVPNNLAWALLSRMEGFQESREGQKASGTRHAHHGLPAQASHEASPDARGGEQKIPPFQGISC